MVGEVSGGRGGGRGGEGGGGGGGGGSLSAVCVKRLGCKTDLSFPTSTDVSM